MKPTTCRPARVVPARHGQLHRLTLALTAWLGSRAVLGAMNLTCSALGLSSVSANRVAARTMAADPLRAIVEFPEFDLPGYRAFFFGRHHWRTSAARMIENFMDISHFPWVHPGTLGDRSKPLVPNIDVKRGDGELYFEVESDGRSR